MKLIHLRPILQTHRLDETIRFYTEFLGFQLRDRNDQWGWAALTKDTIELMFSVPNTHISSNKTNFTGSFYFVTDHVDDLWERIKNKVEIAYPISEFEWEMKEFGIYDNNGYILQFGQDTTVLY